MLGQHSNYCINYTQDQWVVLTQCLFMHAHWVTGSKELLILGSFLPIILGKLTQYFVGAVLTQHWVYFNFRVFQSLLL